MKINGLQNYYTCLQIAYAINQLLEHSKEVIEILKEHSKETILPVLLEGRNSFL